MKMKENKRNTQNNKSNVKQLQKDAKLLKKIHMSINHKGVKKKATKGTINEAKLPQKFKMFTNNL